MILMLDGAGKVGFCKSIIEFALKRHRDKTPLYKTRLHPTLGMEIVAARNIKEGERIYKVEETAHNLVTKKHVENTWEEGNKELFNHFAYPISEDLFVLWSDEPEDWKPMNHSCDPNAWVTGLDLYARKDIAKGEPIRMDYATMYTHNQANFKCLCGEEGCRGTWKSDDFIQPWFIERYGDHVTDHVKQSRKALLHKN